MKILVNETISPHRYKDNHGYLVCTDCVLARTGKQEYTKDDCYEDGDETKIMVDRTEKQVFDPKTLASFENVPLTIEHPEKDVDPDNYNSLAVGYVRDIHKGTYENEPVMMGTIVITDSEGIEKVETGELTNLSCGYDCTITKGEHPEQIDIRGNHIALCKIPRAGITHIQDSLKEKPSDKVVIKNVKIRDDTKESNMKVKQVDLSKRRRPVEDDVVKTSKGYANKGKEGTHGLFTTKKGATQQTKARYANGYKKDSKTYTCDDFEELLDSVNAGDYYIVENHGSYLLYKRPKKLLAQYEKKTDAERELNKLSGTPVKDEIGSHKGGYSVYGNKGYASGHVYSSRKKALPESRAIFLHGNKTSKECLSEKALRHGRQASRKKK